MNPLWIIVIRSARYCSIQCVLSSSEKALQLLYFLFLKSSSRKSHFMNMRITKYLYLWFHLEAAHVIGYVIETRLGLLNGTINVARNKKLYHSYSKIPYAKPPIRALRFKPPVGADKWNGILDATQIAPRCPQVVKRTSSYDGEEDCLYLNIYTPKDAKPGSNFPVIFYIFGGTYKYGEIRTLGPQNFMSRDIVMVFVSFRLGVLGFLSTGDSVVPGNMGLKDQTMALRWTKENIYDFGGDPERVTIQGHSSGAVCAHLHTMSPLSKDYFHRAIMQSGLSVTAIHFADMDVAASMTKILCERLNCPLNSSVSMFTCLNEKTAEELVVAADTLQIWRKEPATLFRPTIEGDVEDAFLAKHPLQASYQSDTKQWLLGITNKEAAAYVNDSEETSNAATIFKENSKLHLPIVDAFKWSAKANHVNFIGQILETHFFSETSTSLSADDDLVEMQTGILHGSPLIQVVEDYQGPKYVYLYNYRGGYSNQGSKVFRGVAHADEVAILFVGDKEGVTENDLEFGDEIITRWVNFAYTGDPNRPYAINKCVFAEWKPVFSKRLEYLTIMQNGTMGADQLVDRFRFWKNIPIFGKYI